MRRNLVLKPEHLTLMMVANATEDPCDGTSLLGIVRGLCNYVHGEPVENACLTDAAKWVVSEIIEAQEENNGGTEV
jgi:hypothetical protein